MPFCTNCGAKLAPDDMFCSSCGQKIEPLIEKAAAPEEPQPEAENAEETAEAVESADVAAPAEDEAVSAEEAVEQTEEAAGQADEPADQAAPGEPVREEQEQAQPQPQQDVAYTTLEVPPQQSNCLVASIIGIVFSIVISLVGLIISAAVLYKIKRIPGLLTNNNKTAKILATVGVVIAVLVTVAAAAFFILNIGKIFAFLGEIIKIEQI